MFHITASMTEEAQKTPLNGKRVRELRRAQKLTQKDLAQRMGVTDAAISQWEKNGGIAVTRLPQLAKILKTTADDLIGRHQPSPERLATSVVSIDTASSVRVPLVSLRGLTLQNMAQRMIDARANGSFAISSVSVSEEGLSFSVIDRSMEPEYRISEIVCVDQVPLEPGDHVVAHIRTLNVTIFRVFEFEGTDFRKLVPLNSQYQALRFTNDEWQQDVEVIGVMVSHFRTRRTRHTP